MGSRKLRKSMKSWKNGTFEIRSAEVLQQKHENQYPKTRNTRTYKKTLKCVPEVSGSSLHMHSSKVSTFLRCLPYKKFRLQKFPKFAWSQNMYKKTNNLFVCLRMLLCIYVFALLSICCCTHLALNTCVCIQRYSCQHGIVISTCAQIHFVQVVHIGVHKNARHDTLSYL